MRISRLASTTLRDKSAPALAASESMYSQTLSAIVAPDLAPTQ